MKFCMFVHIGYHGVLFPLHTCPLHSIVLIISCTMLIFIFYPFELHIIVAVIYTIFWWVVCVFPFIFVKCNELSIKIVPKIVIIITIIIIIIISIMVNYNIIFFTITELTHVAHKLLMILPKKIC